MSYRRSRAVDVEDALSDRDVEELGVRIHFLHLERRAHSRVVGTEVVPLRLHWGCRKHHVAVEGVVCMGRVEAVDVGLLRHVLVVDEVGHRVGIVHYTVAVVGAVGSVGQQERVAVEAGVRHFEADLLSR